MLLTMQLAMVEKTGISDYYRDKLVNIAAKLESKTSVPAIAEEVEWLEYIQSANFWTDLTLDELEQTRKRLRLLMRFMDKEGTGYVYTNFQDELLGVNENEGIYVPTSGNELQLYRKRIESYIKENQDNLTIARLRKNLPITRLDLDELDVKLMAVSGIGDLTQYQETIHPDKSLGVFIRELVGMDRGAAKEAFAEYLDEAKFNAQQLRFINTIIDYLTQNGVMSAKQLAQPPFSDIHYEGITGVFSLDEAIQIRDTLKGIEKMAVGE